MRYWLCDNLGNAGDLVMHYGMKLIPMDACSAIGARLGRHTFPRWRQMAVTRAKANLQMLRPDLDSASREVMLDRNWANQGRLMTEFSIVNRVAEREGRVSCRGLQHVRDAARAGGVILVGLHLGNWEVSARIFARHGIRPLVVYAPPRGRARHWIARRVRSQGGFRLLPPGKDAVRPLMKGLKAGEPALIFCDEGFRGVIRGPLFGRPPHLKGNLALAVRLAHLTGAPILPFYVLREGEALRFSFTALPLMRFEPDAEDVLRGLLTDISRLNAVIEPIVRAHVEQWYFLDNRLARG